MSDLSSSREKESERQQKSWVFRLGIILLIISVPVWFGVFTVPFLSLQTGTKVALSTGLLIAGEILFWSGGILVGKEIIQKYKSKLNPFKWFKKNKNEKNL